MNLSIRSRLFLLVGVAALGLMTQGGLSFYQTNDIFERTDFIKVNSVPSVRASSGLLIDFINLRTREGLYALSDAPDYRKAYTQYIDDAFASEQKHREEVRSMLSSEEESQLFKKYEQLFAEYKTAHDQFILLENAGNEDESEAILTGQMRDLYFETTKTLEGIANINEEAIIEHVDNTQQSIKTGWAITGGLLTLCLLLLATISWTTLQTIMRGVAELTRAFGALAGLDLRVKANVHSNDEVGKTLDQLNITTTNLKNVVSNTQQAANSVAAASHELSSGMESIATITERQGDALHSIAAALEETSASAQEVNTKAQHSGTVTLQVVSSIEGVSNRVVQLRENAKRIGEVLGVIRNVSEQINLLSLNASIEAARAGDAGRGFAVVADEVKKLASSTSSHTDEIAQVVNLLQQSVKETFDALETTMASLEDVRSGSESVVSAVEQQTIAVNDITRTISEFRDQMESVMSNVREAQTASLSLSAAAEQLNQQNSQFKV